MAGKLVANGIWVLLCLIVVGGVVLAGAFNVLPAIVFGGILLGGITLISLD